VNTSSVFDALPDLLGRETKGKGATGSGKGIIDIVLAGHG